MQRNTKKTRKEKRIPTNVVASLASLFIIIGGFFLSYNYVQSKKIRSYDYMANVFYEQSAKENKENKGVEETQQEEVTEVSLDQNGYIGYLEIPKINLNKGFLDKNNPENDVEKNIYVSPISNYPNSDKGNLIIAAHSGTGWKAFFNELYQLNTGDYAYVVYKNKKYTYKIDKIYKQPKTGKIAIYRDYEKTTLTLVTCTNNDSKTQTIYIAYLDKTEDI